MRNEMEAQRSKHFVLVHGGCHGAWCWYKLSTLLKSSGHEITAVDLAACGIHSKKLEEVQSFDDYAQPLMDLMASLPPDKRVILVGHSFGGVVLSLAMERFPNKISVAVFAAAMMPNILSPPSIIIRKLFEELDSLMDSELQFGRGPDNPPTSLLFGPKFLASKVYQCCPHEDHTLATMLVRPGNPFEEEMSKENMLSKETYGSVRRVYIICKDDALITKNLQCWMIENNPPDEVMEIDGSDHMVMLSKPQELCHCLLEIAERDA